MLRCVFDFIITLVTNNVVINEGEITSINGDLTPKLVKIFIAITDVNTGNPLPNGELQLVSSEGTESFTADDNGNLNISFELDTSLEVTFNVIYTDYQNPAVIHTLSPGQTYNFNFALIPVV